MEITLFPDARTIIWTIVNFAFLLVTPLALILVVVYLMRLGRRVRRIEERLNQKPPDNPQNT